MVNSTTVSLTPAHHAANHSVGGSDPLIPPILTLADYAALNIPIYDPNMFNGIIKTDPTMYQTHEQSYAKIVEKTISLTGNSVLAIRYSGRGTDTAAQCYFNIYRNGVAVGTEHGVIKTAWTTWEELIDGWADGDLLQIYSYQSGTSSTYAQMKDLTLYGEGYVAIVPDWT